MWSRFGPDVTVVRQLADRALLTFAADGAVKSTVTTERLETVNDVLARMRQGRIEGRVVLDFA